MAIAGENPSNPAPDQTQAQPSIEDRIGAHLAPPPEQQQEAAPGEGGEPSSQETPEPGQAAISDESGEESAENAEASAEAAESAESADDAVEVETLQDLAQHLNVEVGDLYALRIPVTDPDGQRRDVSLSEWKDAFQGRANLTKLQTEAKEAREAVEAERLQLQQAWKSRLDEANAVMQFAEKQLLADMEGIDWQALNQEDPGRFAAQRQIMTERQKAIAQAKAQVAETTAQAQRELQQQQSQQQAEYLQKEAAALTDAIPEWRSDETAKAEKQAVAEYLSGMFSPAEIEGVMDHRAIVLARKAMLYDKTVKSAEATKKRVVKIGKTVLKPAASQPKDAAKQDQLAAKRGVLRKSGKVEDAAALISALSQ